jgi:hypothetical protein
VLVNGQTGKVGGVKPRDTVKVALMAVIGVILVLMLVALIIWLLASFSGAA